jgi:mitogen-activated protein kinase 1/3
MEENEEELFIVMEYCDTDLKKVCANPKGLPLRMARRLAYNLLVGCTYLHSKGVYHRDLKPANCLANRDCSVKICDFNLARSVGRAAHDSPAEVGGGGENEEDGEFPPMMALKRCLTKHVVTRWYRAPEVILELTYTEAIDVWSAGCIIGELFCALNEEGRTPQAAPLFRGSACAPLSGNLNAHGDQLDRILDVLGTPFDTPEFKALPHHAQRILRCYEKRTGEGLGEAVPPEAGVYGLELLEQMVQFFPETRLSMADALNHSFFRLVQRSPDEGTATAALAGGDGASLDLGFEESSINSEEELREQFLKEIARFNPQDDWNNYE